MGGGNSPACLLPDIITESSLTESPTVTVIGPLLPEMEKECKERPYIYIDLTTPPGSPSSASVTHPISPTSAPLTCPSTPTIIDLLTPNHSPSNSPAALSTVTVSALWQDSSDIWDTVSSIPDLEASSAIAALTGNDKDTNITHPSSFPSLSTSAAVSPPSPSPATDSNTSHSLAKPAINFTPVIDDQHLFDASLASTLRAQHRPTEPDTCLLGEVTLRKKKLTSKSFTPATPALVPTSIFKNPALTPNTSKKPLPLDLSPTMNRKKKTKTISIDEDDPFRRMGYQSPDNEYTPASSKISSATKTPTAKTPFNKSDPLQDIGLERINFIPANTTPSLPSAPTSPSKSSLKELVSRAAAMHEKQPTAYWVVTCGHVMGIFNSFDDVQLLIEGVTDPIVTDFKSDLQAYLT
ncbi:uncharacterized protein ARMOST_00559 [Armillaria ostoyae]|uniref:Uncharacterized protein n=1 Tax=Armillaria ostoyae TaxID=47428 RepID=A0A284QLG2_ARMOS|nr:uncharacterized protein ARMOST_00559 [Armillaria ostoyae]